MKISFLKIAGAFSLVLFWLIGSWQSAGAVNVQSYEGLVNDYAQVLSDEVENSLETRLQDEASKENGAELAVVTLPSLDGEEIESVALAYFDTWKIGKAKQDNGVLLLIAISDREIRIQTGYGVEPIIPDGVAGRIIRNDIVPY
ncbi:MAG TPA: TPM domain-containing protein, partial [Candidatus Woesebacteria bacterium]|nr:TPM domain-containing protein [Candidatus Woesebacteria bacterium]